VEVEWFDVWGRLESGVPKSFNPSPALWINYLLSLVTTGRSLKEAGHSFNSRFIQRKGSVAI
jgi:hypothetical protein